MKINKKIFICALLVLMVLCCVNAASAEEPLNETLGSDAVDEIAISAPVDELSVNVEETEGDAILSASDADPELAAGKTIYVSTAGSDSNDGLSEANAVATINHAVDIADGKIVILAGEYTVTSILNINKDLEITGQGDVTIKSNSKYSVEVWDDWEDEYTSETHNTLINNSANLKLDNIKFTLVPASIKDELIYNVGNLYVTDCEFTNIKISSGRGVIQNAKGGYAEVKDTTFQTASSTYGAINNNGELLVDGCKFLDNDRSSDSGVFSTAITSYNKATILNSEFKNNKGTAGGAVYVMYSYLLKENPVMDIKNCTFDSNNAPGTSYTKSNGGAVKCSGKQITLNIEDSTFTNNHADNGGAVYAEGNVTIVNSVFHGNTASIGEDVYVASGSNAAVLGCTVDDSSHLWEADGGNLTVGEAPAPEITEIYVSPAGDDAKDGSSEANAVATIAHAIEIANAGDVHKIIILEGTHTLDAALSIASDLEIVGQGNAIIDGNSKRILENTANLNLTNLTFTNGKIANSVIWNKGNTTIDGCTFYNLNTTGASGAGPINNGAGTMIINNSKIYNSKGARGVIASQTGTKLIINNSEIYDNDCTSFTNSYGIVYGTAADIIAENTVFRNNKAKSGAGFYVTRSTSATTGSLEANNLTFENNIAKVGTGGAVFVSGNNIAVNINDSKFINNSAAASASNVGGYGAAIYLGTGTGKITVTKSIFVDNTANNTNYNEAGIYMGAGSLDISDSVILTKEGDSRYALQNDGATVTAENNWWGSNDAANTNVNVEKIVKMDASFTPADAVAGDEVTVTATFDNVNLPDGINVTFTSTSGNLNTVVATVGGQSSTTYTIDANDEAINAISTNAVVEMPIVSPFTTNIVTQDNFYTFFDDSGILKESVPYDELIFQGEFSDLAAGYVIITKPVTITGDNAVLNNLGIVVSASGVSLNNLTFNANTALGDLVNVVEANVNLNNLNITYIVDNEAARAVSIIGASGVKANNLNITFESHVTDSATDACAINIEGSENVVVTGSEINSSLPALYVNYSAATTMFMGLDQVNPVRIMESSKINITGNIINSLTNDYSQDYATIQAMLIAESTDCFVDSNNITLIDEFAQVDQDIYLYGISFAYDKGLVMSNNNFTIHTNGGKEAAGTAYAIQGIESALSIIGNNITTFSNGPNLGIYVTSMAGETSTMIIEDNFINVTGLAAAGNNWALVSGIEIQNGDAKIYNNTIYTYNTDEYDEADYLSGISYIQYMYGGRSFDIQDNTVYTDGKYAVYLIDASNSVITGNTLYAHDLTGDDAVYIEKGDNNLVQDNLPGYEGIIYVNATGNDKNKGSIDAPVASVAKAVELAQGKSGQIIIDQGAYDIEATIEITDDLNITTVGDVVLAGPGSTSVKAFYIKSGDVSISNLTFINFNASYTGSVIRVAAGSLTLDGTNFVKNGGENREAIVYVRNADLTLTNSIFRDNTAHKTSTSYGIVSVGTGTLYMDNCNFTDNYNKYGCLYLSSVIATIYNSSFIGNNATSSSGGTGAGIYVSGTATYISSYSNKQINGSASYVLVQGCEFINNTAFGARLYAGQGGAIYVNNNVTIFIDDCLFENNSVTNTTGNDKAGQGGAIYSSAGKIIISGSTFKNNDAAEGSEIYMRYYNNHIHPEEVNYVDITDSIILNDGENVVVADNNNGTYTANNNWWGTNDEPASKVNDNVTVDSWAKMNATFTPEGAYKGEITVIATFDNPNLPDGINVTFTSTSGNLNTVVAAKDGKATATYTIDANDKEIVATSTDAEIVMPIIVPKANVTVSADTVWIGNDANVTVSVPNATGTVTVVVNGKNQTADVVDGVATFVIAAEDLTLGENTVNATYEGTDFASNSDTGVITVIDGVITNATYKYYFDASCNLVAAVPDGATLDFQGLFLGKFPVYINKAVNVVSSTDDALFDAGETFAGNAIDSFNVVAGGDNTNITGLEFINYCLYIKGASNVTVDDISIVANKRGVGSGTGFLSIHTGAYNTVVKNSYFENGGTGSSLLVLGKGGAYAYFDHNVFNITGSSGNILSANQFVGSGNAPEHVSYTNNVLYNSQPASGFCYAMTVSGSGNLVENNTIYHNGSGILNQYGASSTGNVYRNNTLYGNTNFNPSANSIVENNKIYATTNIAANTTAVGNTFTTVAISGTNTTFANNTVSGTVTVKGNNNVVKDNNITATGDYAVVLGSTTGNNVTDNYLIANLFKGDRAVSYANENLVENNLPVLNIIVTVDGATYPENVTVKVDAIVDGDFTVDINGTEYVVAANGDGISIKLGVGSYYANITGNYSDYGYTVVTENTTFAVAPGVNDIVVIVEDTVLPGDVVVKVTANVPDTYTVVIGDATVDVVVDETGEGSNTISLLKGKYTATTSWENENYTATVTDAKFTVSRAEGFINITADDIAYGEDLIVNVTLPDDVARRAIVTVDNETKYVSLVNGTGSVKFSGLAAGAHTVVASYNGDGNYLALSANTTVNVNRAVSGIEVVAKAHNYGYDVVVDVILPSDVARRAIVTIGNESKFVSLTDGKGSVSFSGLAAGTYTVVASYNGDANYKKCSANTTVVVAKEASDIKVTANPVSYGEDVVVEVVLPYDVSRRAVVTLGNETKYVSLVNGVGSVKFSGLAIGSYDVVASYNGDNNYIISSASTVAKVTKAVPEIQVSANDINVGEALVVDVQLPSDVTKRATVTIGNESKLVTLKEGIGSVKFTGIEVGTHDVVVSYVGDATYKASSNTTTIEVKA